MVYTARIDVANHKHIAVALALVVGAILFAVILGQAGPHLSDFNDFSTYNCTDPYQHNHYTPNNCSGLELSTGVWSSLMMFETQILNKHWFCGVTTYINDKNLTEGLPSSFNVYAQVLAKNSLEEPWSMIENSSIAISDFYCQDVLQCTTFLLLYYESIDYNYYGIHARILNTDGSPIDDLADVEFTIITDDPGFSTMSLSLKMIYLLISVGIFAFHFLRLKGKKSYWAYWTDEQKLFVFLLISLVFYNNPFFALGFVVRGWFFPFLGAFLELVFTCILFTFWFIMAEKMRSEDNGIKASLLLKISVLLVALYAIISTVLYGLASAQDSQPLFQPNQTVDIIYYTSSALYISIVLFFFGSLVISLQSLNQKQDLRIKFIFFAVPTVIVIVSVLVGIFLGTLGPFGRDGPSFVYFLTLYNTYVYLLVWGYWPVDISFGNEPISGETKATEGSFLFAKEPKN